MVQLQALPIPEKDELMNVFVKEFGLYLDYWCKMIINIRANYGNSLGNDDNGKPKKVSSNQGDVEFIANCLHFYRRVNMLLSHSLQSHSQMAVSITQALHQLMNTNIDTVNEKDVPAIPTEMLSVYCDKIMKKSDSSSNSSELEGWITDCVLLFKHIRDKDVFIENYRDLLGKRLLNNKSSSIEDEKLVILKINFLQGKLCLHVWILVMELLCIMILVLYRS